MDRWFLVVALAALAPNTLAAQAPALSEPVPIIRAVELRRDNIFSPHEATSFFPRLANSLHLTTRARVVRRELLFRAGDPYDSARTAETARTLRRLGVFRSVRLDTVHSDTGLVMRVLTADGWSTKPDFRFYSAGRSVVYTLALEESNFLGTATLVGLRYRHHPDRSTLTASFRQPRLLAGRVGTYLVYEDRSDGSLAYASLSRPFFALSERTAWQADMQTRKETILRFFEGADTAGQILQRRYFLAYASAAWALRADSRGYLRAGVFGQVRRDDYADQSRVDTLGHHVTGSAGGFLQIRRARFLVSRGLEGIGREQDIDISTVLGVSLSASPRAFGYDEVGVAPSVSLGTGFGTNSGFVRLNAIGTGRLTSAGLDSGSVQLSGTAFLLPGTRHMAVLHAAAGWQERPAPGAEFDLGLGIGPRGFRQHAFTGDRVFFTTAEYRYTVIEEFLKNAAIGLAGFVDYGGAWYHGAKRRTGWDAGIGLRIGLTRAIDVEGNRLDLVYRGKTDVDKGGWTFTVGKGFAFQLTGRLDR